MKHSNLIKVISFVATASAALAIAPGCAKQATMNRSSQQSTSKSIAGNLPADSPIASALAVSALSLNPSNGITQVHFDSPATKFYISVKSSGNSDFSLLYSVVCEGVGYSVCKGYDGDIVQDPSLDVTTTMSGDLFQDGNPNAVTLSIKDSDPVGTQWMVQAFDGTNYGPGVIGMISGPRMQ